MGCVITLKKCYFIGWIGHCYVAGHQNIKLFSKIIHTLGSSGISVPNVYLCKNVQNKFAYFKFKLHESNIYHHMVWLCLRWKTCKIKNMRVLETVRIVNWVVSTTECEHIVWCEKTQRFIMFNKWVQHRFSAKDKFQVNLIYIVYPHDDRTTRGFSKIFLG